MDDNEQQLQALCSRCLDPTFRYRVYTASPFWTGRALVPHLVLL